MERNVVPHRNPPLRRININEMSIGLALKILENKRLKASRVNA
jgi:hypothetical protein